MNSCNTGIFTNKTELIIFYPFGIIYGLILWLRNKLFDWGILKERKFNIPIIGLGNLSLGGTGKTPHIEYYISKLGKEYNIAVVSRGYGRTTNGFRYVNPNDFATEVGDEPLQIKQKFVTTVVAVCEERVTAIEKVLKEHPEINLILLDDAFQHRYVRPSINILLTEYSHPFWNDYVVPAGLLREFRSGWKRADLIIITKCPENKNLKVPEYLRSIPVYYSKLVYNNLVQIFGHFSKNIVLITGIAKPQPLVGYLKQNGYNIFHHFNFPDHHNFTASDIENIVSKFNEQKDLMLLTTEKDWMRIKTELSERHLNMAYIPIDIEIENAPINWLIRNKRITKNKDKNSRL